MESASGVEGLEKTKQIQVRQVHRSQECLDKLAALKYDNHGMEGNFFRHIQRGV